MKIKWNQRRKPDMYPACTELFLFSRSALEERGGCRARPAGGINTWSHIRLLTWREIRDEFKTPVYQPDCSSRGKKMEETSGRTTEEESLSQEDITYMFHVLVELCLTKLFATEVFILSATSFSLILSLGFGLRHQSSSCSCKLSDVLQTVNK